MKKRILATLLSLCLMVGLLPVTAMAADDPALSGNCGATGSESSVTWALTVNNDDTSNPTYTLTISGTGAMASYAANTNNGGTVAPWRSYYEKITRVVIGEGVTNIGSNSFRNAYGSYTFSLSSTVQTIEDAALFHCWIDAFEVAENSQYFKAVDGVLISKDGTKLVRYPNNKTNASYTVPDGVTEISDEAFRNPFNLKTIAFPDSLTTIGNSAFRGHSMPAIHIKSNSITTIKDLAFADEWGSVKDLTEIYLDIPTLTTLGTNLDSHVFAGATNLSKVYLNIPEIPGSYFRTNYIGRNLSSLTFGNAVKKIKANAFGGQTKLTVLDLRDCAPELNIGTGAFYACSGLVAVLMPKNISQVEKGALDTTANTTIYCDNTTDLAKLTSDDANKAILAVTNGGTFAQNTSFTAGSLATPTKESYTFGGWYSDASFTEDSKVTESTTISAGNTYYAKWVSHVKLDVSEGEVTPGYVDVAKDAAYGDLPTPTRTGYDFQGWYTAGGTKVTTDTVPTGNTTLYAQWTPNTYTISFNGGTASGSTASVTATYDKPATLTANGFTLTGKNFAGWTKTENGTTVEYADGAQVKNLTAEANGTVTLYAVWTDKQVLTPDKSVQTKTYNGAAQAFTLDGYNISYKQNGEVVTAPTNAGSYDVVISAAETETTAAYPETTIPGGLVIDPATLTITADNKTMYVNGTLPTYTYTVTGWKGSDSTLAAEPTVACEADGKTTGTYTIVASGANAGDNYIISYVDGTLTVYAYSSGGGSSSSSSTTTTKNPDGSTTTTTTNKTTGTVTEVTKDKDGTTTTVETKKDGTVTETVKTTNGTTGTVVTDKNGNVTEVKASVSSTAVKEAAKTGEAVTLPVEIPAAKTTEDAPAVQVTVPKSAGSVKVEVPVEKVTPGTVAVIVKADGTEEIVKTSIPTENGVALKLDGSATVKVIDNAKDFSDTKGHWAEDAISFVTAREMFAGTSATTFTPNSQMTRAQLMTVLARFDGVDTNGGSVWYEKGMEWAKANGVSDGSNPNGSITREQLATMLWRYSGSPVVEGGVDSFNDAGKVNGYATDAMRWAVETGLIGGIGNNTLAPQGNATRAQLATILMRYCENIVE